MKKPYEIFDSWKKEPSHLEVSKYLVEKTEIYDKGENNGICSELYCIKLSFPSFDRFLYLKSLRDFVIGNPKIRHLDYSSSLVLHATNWYWFPNNKARLKVITLFYEHLKEKESEGLSN